MSTRAKLEDLRVRSQKIEQGGGEKAVQKQHE
ncbi:MAG: hypothetical protein PWP71_2596, partial [Clostridia bacterium]|nr:hypothetical protein [Clostridia bacterium]MDK2824678.1 hypothetical protein [Clostridia bacterium]